MAYRITCLIIIIKGCLVHELPAQFLSSDARALGLGGAVTAFTGLHGLFNNPASLETDKPAFQFCGGVPYAGLGLNSFSAGFSIPIKQYFLSAGMRYLGDDVFRTGSFSAGLSRKFSHFRLGIRPEWHLQALDSGMTVSGLYMSAGSIWEMGNSFYLGFYIHKGLLHGGDQFERDKLSAGLVWKASEHLWLTYQWSMRSGRINEAVLGVQFNATRRVQCMTAWRIDPVRWHFGFAFRLERSQMHYSTGLDPWLGQHHSFSFTWQKPGE